MFRCHGYIWLFIKVAISQNVFESWQLVPKFGKVVKFFKGSVHQRRGGHMRVSRIEDNIFSIYVYCEKGMLKVKVFRPFFRHNSVSVSNFLPCIVFGVDSFFTIALSFVLHKRRPRTGMR
jgi:hypothetical protein